jgi:hypothetical protein
LIARSFELPRQVELASPTRKGRMERPISDLERNTEIARTSENQWFLSLFNGQGARRRATETSSGRIAASAGV